ncbi:hypothetical protein GCM10027053_03150 [Intrasporangium mesophilum]
MKLARFRHHAVVAVLLVVIGIAAVGLIASPFARNPLVPLGAALGISFILVLSAISLSRRDPVSVLTVMLTALFLIPGGYVIVGPLKSVGNPAELIGLLALALWGAGRVLGLLPARSGHPVRWLLLAWAMTTGMAFAAGMLRVLAPEESNGAVRALFPLAAVMGIALFAVDGLRSREMVERTLFRLVVLAGLSALIGIVEFGLGLEYRTAMQLPGLTSDTDDYVDTRAGFVRVQGGASHPIEYAVVLVAVAPIALHFALNATGRSRRAAAWLAFVAILAVIPMTVSRSGIVALLVALGVYAVQLSPRQRLNGVLAGVVGLVLFRAAVPGILGTLEYFLFAGSSDSSITARTDDYDRIPALISGHELLGRGFGTFGPTQYFYVDNQYILTLLEGGFVSLAVLVAIFVVGMSLARGYRKRSTEEAERGLGQALAASIAAVAISAATFDEFSFRQTFFTFALVLGCAGALWGIARAREEASTVGPAHQGGSSTPAVALASTSAAALTGDRPRSTVATHDRGDLSSTIARPDHTAPAVPSVVFAFAYHTWADAVRRDFSWSADQMARHLLADDRVPSVVVSDPLRSRLARMRRRDIEPDRGFPDDPSRTLVRPLRWRRGDTTGMSTATAYSAFDWWLGGQVTDPASSVLVTCHPVHAAVADRTRWRDVVYYAWDDWLEYPPFEPSRRLYAWSYAQMARRDVHVIGVSKAVVGHVGSHRTTVVPNGIAPGDFHALPPVPSWFSELDRPVAFYAGALERRVDVDVLRRAARDLPDWTLVLVGPMHEPDLFRALSDEPNVQIRPPVPRSQALAMAAASEVCLIPHRETPMSRAMSPLKLYEYLGAGRPVVASDLPPLRDVSDRCLIVSPGDPIAPAILQAADLPRQTEAERSEFYASHSWAQRYAVWRSAVLGVDFPAFTG